MWPPKFEQKLCESKSKEILAKQIKQEFREIFEPGMGEYKCEPIHLSIEPGVKPIFMPARTVPFALKTKVKEEINRL